MASDKYIEDWRDFLYGRYDRRMQLLRGWILRLRGAKTGVRFGIGTGVQVYYPGYLTAGHDVTVMSYAYINCLSEKGVRIGDHTSFHIGLWLDCGGKPGRLGLGFFHIGNHCFIGPHSILGASGGITVGDHVLMGQMVSIHAENHKYKDATKRIDEQGVANQEVVIEGDCWIGAKSSILDGVSVGQGSVIGAGSVVTHNVPPYSVVVGVPGRIIKQRQ